MSFVDIRVVITRGTGGICVTVLCLYIIGRGYCNVTRIRPIIVPIVETSPEQMLKYSSNKTGGFTSRDDWGSRLQQLQKGCHQPDTWNRYIIQNLRHSATFLESKNLNISVCKVPKAGSTLLASVFSIITRRQPASRAFGMARHDIHMMSGKFSFRQRNEHDHLTTRAIVVSRDPYSRLFSVFIDKVYMCPQKTIKLFTKQIQNGPFVTLFGNCGYNISFHDFLDRVTTYILKGLYANRHWSPIYSLCRVCKVKYQHVIKQETLTRDLEYIMNQLNIRSDIKTTVAQMLRGAGLNSTIEGVLQTMFHINFKSNYDIGCSNKLAFAMKLWEGFKMQGYIRSNTDFPLLTLHRFNLESITKAVLRAMHTNPLSSTERKAQRRQALVKAYAGVSKRIISQIQEAYKMDFHLFGYDTYPPS